MTRILTDEEIDRLLMESKPLPHNWKLRLQQRPKSDSQFTQRDCSVNGIDGHKFKIILRQNKINPLDFSIILMFEDKDGTEFHLCRYNGKHPSQHTNRLEKAHGLPNSFFRNVFHIHRATQRYQEEGLDIVGYAEVTTEYSSFEKALDVFLKVNGFSFSDEDFPLFDARGGAK